MPPQWAVQIAKALERADISTKKSPDTWALGRAAEVSGSEVSSACTAAHEAIAFHCSPCSSEGMGKETCQNVNADGARV